MNFHLEFTPKPFATKIKHHQKLLLIGSCFTENMDAKLKLHKFNVLENPNGILFNPISITKSIHLIYTIKNTGNKTSFTKMNAGIVGNTTAGFRNRIKCNAYK